jgi:phospholipase C
LIIPGGDESKSIYPCFEHQTIADILPRDVSWRYYAPGAGIWTAPNAIAHICEPIGHSGVCTGPKWLENVDSSRPVDVLADITNCNLRSLSWVIPTGANSDHARANDGGGPSWVASIVNAVGSSTTCDGNTGYWNNTALFITWDDWGGWYDHVPPPILLNVPQGDYERGFRVPMIVVSAYTKQRYISNRSQDFGSMLCFVERNFGIEQGALNFADARTAHAFGGFFSLSQARPYKFIAAPKTASFFLNDKRPLTAPDDD